MAVGHAPDPVQVTSQLEARVQSTLARQAPEPQFTLHGTPAGQTTVAMHPVVQSKTQTPFVHVPFVHTALQAASAPASPGAPPVLAPPAPGAPPLARDPSRREASNTGPPSFAVRPPAATEASLPPVPPPPAPAVPPAPAPALPPAPAPAFPAPPFPEPPVNVGGRPESTPPLRTPESNVTLPPAPFDGVAPVPRGAGPRS
jgi:hypothetical protein